MCKMDAGNFKVGGGLNLGGLGEDLKKSLGGGNWTKRLGIQMDTTTLNQFKNNQLNTIAGAGKNIQSNINWAKDRIGPNAWDKGQWLQDRIGLEDQEGGQLWRKSGFDVDLAKEGLGGGDWMDRLGLGDYTQKVLGHWGDELGKAGEGLRKGNFDKAWGERNWQDRLGFADYDYMGEFNKTWGGGAWWKDRMGASQFDPKKGGGGADTGDEPTSTTPNTTTETETTTETQMNQLTNEDPQEAARLAATRARRRRALKNKFGKRQTIRTSGRGATGY